MGHKIGNFSHKRENSKTLLYSEYHITPWPECRCSRKAIVLSEKKHICEGPAGSRQDANAIKTMHSGVSHSVHEPEPGFVQFSTQNQLLHNVPLQCVNSPHSHTVSKVCILFFFLSLKTKCCLLIRVNGRTRFGLCTEALETIFSSVTCTMLQWNMILGKRVFFSVCDYMNKRNTALCFE